MDISKSVMEKIKSNKIKVKPRIVFVLANVALGVGIALSVVIAVVSANFLFHAFEERPLFRLAGLGRLGIIQSFAEVPWLYLIVTAAFLGTGLYLLTKTDLIYKRNPLPIIIAIILLVLFAGFAFNKTGINRQLRKNPGMRRFLETKPTDVWVQGTVVEVNNTNIKIRLSNGSFLTLIATDNTILSTGPVRVGNCVRALGTINDKAFETQGIFGCPKRYLETSERNF